MEEILLSGAAGALIVWLLQVFTERRRRRYERRLYILRSLISNANNVVSVEFVSAFNMILIEYGSKTEVRKWHEEFIKHVHQAQTKNKEELKIRSEKFNEILVKLIESLAKSIHIQIEQIDVSNKIYWPQGFVDNAAMQKKLIDLLICNQETLKNLFKQISTKNLEIAVGAKHKNKKKTGK